MGVLVLPRSPCHVPIPALPPACHIATLTATIPTYTPTKPPTQLATPPPKPTPADGPHHGPHHGTHQDPSRSRQIKSHHDVLRPTPQRKTDRPAAHPLQWRRAAEHQHERGQPVDVVLAAGAGSRMDVTAHGRGGVDALVEGHMEHEVE